MDLVKFGGIIMPVPVVDSFRALAAACNNDINVVIKPEDGFKPPTAIRTELRLRIKRLDVKSRILTNEEFDSLSPTVFEPPITGNVTANRNTNELVYTIPNYVGLDPRSSGRIVKIGPKKDIRPTTLHYLIYNAGKYGFVHYGPKDPTIWYWRGDINPTYTPDEVVNMFTGELKYLM